MKTKKIFPAKTISYGLFIIAALLPITFFAFPKIINENDNCFFILFGTFSACISLGILFLFIISSQDKIKKYLKIIRLIPVALILLSAYSKSESLQGSKLELTFAIFFYLLAFAPLDLKFQITKWKPLANEWNDVVWFCVLQFVGINLLGFGLLGEYLKIPLNSYCIIAGAIFAIISKIGWNNKLKTEIFLRKAAESLLSEKNKEITDSIVYAKRLQEAILPPKEYISQKIPNHFVLFIPKDIVAGDFYWAEEMNDQFFIAAADSTGHGVPGALVSIVCSNALNRALHEFKIMETGKLLDKTRELVVETFEKSNTEVKDGMDISLLSIDRKNKKIFWSGANNPLWFFKNNEFSEIKADKQSIGKSETIRPFTTHEIPYIEGNSFYLFTDGFSDQFGGPKGKKFKYAPFSNLLKNLQTHSPDTQCEKLKFAFLNWKGPLEQVDDVCVIGIKI